MEKENEKKELFVSIFDDEIIPYVCTVTPEGESRRADVGIEINQGQDNEMTIILKPTEAKELAKRILEIADEALDTDYCLLTRNAPF